MSNNRPTFYTDNGQPIRAAGILCFIDNKESNKKYWLFRKQNNLFTDTGGKTDSIDSSALDTAIRETVEETNGRLFSEKHNSKYCYKILKREISKQNINPIYIESCKYLLFPLKLRIKNFELPLDRFGKLELHDNLEHSYHWLDEIPAKNIHPRLITLKKKLIIT
mgnify:CR=1 FL=1